MSELRSAIEPYRSEVLAGLPETRVAEDLDELRRAADAIELEHLRRVAELDRRGAWARDGYLSTAAWLADRHRIGWGTAKAQVRLARDLERMPGVRGALEGGEVSLASARVLAEAHRVDPEGFADAEDAFVEAARRHTIAELGRVASRWRERRLAARAGDPDEGLRARRGLYASVTFGGMVRVDGDLDPETGETLMTALGAVLDHEARTRTEEDARTPAQRRADALGEICRGWLDRGDRPTVAGERPHVTVTVDLPTLRDGRGEVGRAVDAALAGGAEFAHTGAVAPPVARRLACDASVARVVLSGSSEPLDVGRRTPVVPPAMRRAVVVRDRGCRFPGCDRPQGWCDAHHVRHWADGGPTSLANLVLLCRRHHRLVHARGGFTLALEGGRAVFRRPDGSVLDRDRKGRGGSESRRPAHRGPEDRAPP
jgi:hypothetical protein